jgi:diguanylate cyclase (GGDEF)-like protein
MVNPLAPVISDLEELADTMPGHPADAQPWMKRVRDFCDSCVFGGALRPKRAEIVPWHLHGRLENAVAAFRRGSGESYSVGAPKHVAHIIELRTTFQEALAGSALKHQWSLGSAADSDTKFSIASAATFEHDRPIAVAEATLSQSLAILLIDLDSFKKVNDTHGHTAGDDALRRVSGLLSDVAEGRGKAYRFGGDEFSCMFDNCGLNEALATGERIRASVASQTYDQGFSTTVSVGVAITSGSDTTDALKEADKALYQAKRRRNAVSSVKAFEPER